MSLAAYIDAYIGAIIKAKIRAAYNSKDLKIVIRDPNFENASHVMIAVVRNEALRLPFFLAYYRNLGFKNFILIDNLSTDNSLNILNAEPGVTVVSAKGSYKGARFGMDWVNFIASKYCTNKWILHVDADEFLVFPEKYCANVLALTESLEKIGQRSMQCMMIDMYGKQAPSSSFYKPGSDPLAVCDLFDSSGYVTSYNNVTKTTWIKGGVRARLFFEEIAKSPALGKTPLVYWRKHYAFLKSAHEVWPPKVNGGRPMQGKIFGALLHFKFLDDFTKKINEEAERRQHTTEYLNYVGRTSFYMQNNMICNATKQFVSFDSLEECGLMPGIYQNIGVN